MLSGGKRRMNQHFKGYLAGLNIVKNRTESDSVIQCLNNCQEKLEFDAIDTNDDTVCVPPLEFQQTDNRVSVEYNNTDP